MIRRAIPLLIAASVAACAAEEPQVEPAQLQQTPAGGPSAPPPLHEEGVALDTGRDRVVLFGGTRAEGDGYVNIGDTWEWDGQAWRLAIPAADGPGVRTVATLAYDPRRQAVVMFGGARGDWGAGPPEQLRDTWTYDGRRWTRGPDGPLAFNTQLLFDDRRSEMLLVGHAGAFPDDEGPIRVSLWRMRGDAWASVDSTGPRTNSPPRPALDSRRGVLVLPVLDGPDAGVWEWDGSRWRRITPQGGPPPRNRFVAAFDERSGRTVLFGGIAGPPPWSFNDAWAWDGARWTALQAGSTAAPAPRSDGTLLYDAKRQRLVLVGGIGNDDDMFRETWTLDGGGWRRAP